MFSEPLFGMEVRVSLDRLGARSAPFYSPPPTPPWNVGAGRGVEWIVLEQAGTLGQAVASPLGAPSLQALTSLPSRTIRRDRRGSELST